MGGREPRHGGAAERHGPGAAWARSTLAEAEADLAADPAAPAPGLFASAAWFHNLLAHGGLAASDALWLVAGADAAAGPATGRFALGLQREGDVLVSLSNYYSSLFEPLGDAGAAPPAAWRAAAATLRRQRARVLQLQPLSREAAWPDALARALRHEGYWTARFFCFGNWYLRVGGRSAEQHFAERPSALRNSVARGRRRLDKAGAWSIEIAQAEGPALEACIADYQTVYGRSWKQAEPWPEFVPGLARMAARQGWLRLGVLRLDGAPLAAQIWLVCAGVANIYKLAYVEGSERLSPGSVLTAALMAHAIDVDRVQEIDYLTGDDAYKRDWMGARRERWGLLAFDRRHWRGWLAALRHHVPRAGRRLAGLLRRRSP